MGQHQIQVEEITPEQFAPFGDFIGIDGLELLDIDNFSGANGIYGPVVLDVDDGLRAEFVLMKSMIRPFQLRYLERHVRITQTFIPLGGEPYLFVGSPPDTELTNGFPDVDSIRAFIVPGTVALNLKRGTWHEPAFPLRSGQLCLVSSHADLTRGLAKGPGDNGEMNELDVEKRNPMLRLGDELKISLNR